MTEKVYSNENSLLKAISIFSFICISVALMLINKNSPATGYEISIYSALPPLVWILLLISISCGIGIITYYVLNNQTSRYWFVGILIIFVVTFIILSLPLIRGYYLNAGSLDPLTHLHFVNIILSEGSFYNNYYPVTHVLAAIIVDISNMSSEKVLQFLPVLFTSIYIIFIFLLATLILERKEQAILAMVGGHAFIFTYYHVSTYPHGLALLTFPLVFFIYFKSLKSPSLSTKLILIILIFLFPFFHPVPELILISSFVTVELVKMKRKGGMLESINFASISLNPALISLLTFYLWLFYFTILGDASLGRIIDWTKKEVSVVARIDELENVFELGTLDFITLLIKMYGHILLFVIISFIALVLCIRYFFQHQHEVQILIILFLISIVAFSAYLIIANCVGLITWGRILGANAGIWGLPVFVGFALYELFSMPKIPKVIGIGAIIVILVLASVIGASSIYRSPWIYQPNWQVTYMDVHGAGWVDSHLSRDCYASLGWLYPSTKDIPEHFGYPEQKSLGEVVEKNTYIVLTERFKQASDDLVLNEWMNIPESLARPGFEREDFIKIQKDPSVEKIYVNGEFEIFLVNPFNKI